MNHRIADLAKNSRIIAFFKNFNKNLLLYFYDSEIHGYFEKANMFFRDVFLKRKDESLILIAFKNIINYIESGKIGFFIVLVVILNTLAMIYLGREIDTFSVTARISFFLLGAFLIFYGICRIRK